MSDPQVMLQWRRATRTRGDPAVPAKTDREANQLAFRKLKPTIDQRYPSGRFVAIDDGDIVADGWDFKSLSEDLRQRGKRPENVLIVQAGIDYPEEAVIF